MSGETIRSLAEEQQQDVRLYHAELMTARDVLDRAGLRAVKIRNLLNMADSVFDPDGSCVMPRLREIPDPDVTDCEHTPFGLCDACMTGEEN